MLKNKTHRIRRISSAALIGLAIYGSSVSQVSANSLKYISGGRQQTKIERSISSEKEGNVIENGTVVSKDGSRLEVIRSRDNLRLSVWIGDQTKIWGGFKQRGSITQILVGDRIGVWGKENVLGEGIVQASMIRDYSQKQKKGVFKGEVVEIVGDAIKVLVKGQLLTIGKDTQIVNRENKTVVFSDIKVGDKFRMSLLRSSLGVSEVISAQDISLPRI